MGPNLFISLFSGCHSKKTTLHGGGRYLARSLAFFQIALWEPNSCLAAGPASHGEFMFRTGTIITSATTLVCHDYVQNCHPADWHHHNVLLPGLSATCAKAAANRDRTDSKRGTLSPCQWLTCLVEKTPRVIDKSSLKTSNLSVAFYSDQLLLASKSHVSTFTMTLAQIPLCMERNSHVSPCSKA